ncbi:MAG TPA: hypothetical protein VJV03_13455 [Pyrinomonadaceae bacterium]|nr:hypothetical protein [Pyrinomonadaceae bacterium]
MTKGSSKLSSLVALGLLLVAVWACNKGNSESPISADKLDYVGEWRGQTANESMTLNIASDGAVNYERKHRAGTQSVESSRSRSITGGKISKFEGNDFVVKVLLVPTTFKVEKPPYRDGRRWKMVVDGMEVSRKDQNSTDVAIASAEHRKDDGSGKKSDETTDTFGQSDRKMHRFVILDNPKAGTRIKFVTIAIEAGKLKNEQINEHIVTTDKDEENEISSSLEMTGKPLPIGDYKVDIYINDKLEETLLFTVI